MRFWTLFALLALATVVDATGVQHPATIEDFLQLSEIGTIRPSPDGRLLAVEIRRPRGSERVVGGDELGFERSDLWLIDLITRKARRLTDGSADGSWHWGPSWAPNSGRLAYLSYAPDQQFSWTVWDRESDRTKALAVPGSIDISVNFGSRSIGRPHGRVAAAWTDNDHFLTVAMPPEADAFPFGSGIETQATEPGRQLVKLWNAARRGDRSVTVWDSKALAVCGQDRKLLRLDVRTGTYDVLLAGAIRAVSVSPRARYAAIVIARSQRAYAAEESVDSLPLGWNGYHADAHVESNLHIIDLSKGSPLGVLREVEGISFLSERRFPRWASDESHFAIPGRTEIGADSVYRVNVPSLATQRYEATSALHAELVAQSLASNFRLPSTDVLDRTGLATSHVRRGQVPGDIAQVAENRVLVFLSGKAVLLDADGRWVAEYGDIAAPSRIVYADGVKYLVMQSEGGLQLLDMDSSGANRTIVPPGAGAELVSIVPSANALIFIADRDDGSYLWVTSGSEKEVSPVLRLNEHLKQVERPRRVSLQYRMPSGELQHALVLMPQSQLDARRGRMIVEGYPAVIVRPGGAEQASMNSFYTLYRHLLVSAGYSVLIPSVPWPQEGDIEPTVLMSDSVLAAVDGAIGQGFATADRVGFLGHSYGGYMGLALASRTNRFRAVVASAAYSDLITYHDTMAPQNRINTCGPGLNRMRSGELEERTGILRMGGPPMRALAKYLRNSPYYQLSSVQTPILLIHGDQDGVNDTMSEQVFLALLRQNVHVQLARYWGETHSLRSPANIRDAWDRTLEWFNSYVQ